MPYAYPKVRDPSRLAGIETPPYVARFLFDLLLPAVRPTVVFDPACGNGNLLDPWLKHSQKPRVKRKIATIGVESDQERVEEAKRRGHYVYQQTFETYESSSMHHKLADPGLLVLCNPPWSGQWQGRHYPEVFFSKILDLFETSHQFELRTPIVMLVPMGFRMNMRERSERLKWFRKACPPISSVISCPLDMYPDTQFHNEILCFNIPSLKAHYWMEAAP